MIAELRTTFLAVTARLARLVTNLWHHIRQSRPTAVGKQSAPSCDTLDKQVWDELKTCKTFSLAIEQYDDTLHEYGSFVSTVILVALQVEKFFFPIFNHNPQTSKEDSMQLPSQTHTP